MSNLKKVLFHEYGGFADKRIKKLGSGSRFSVDDQGPGDRDAKGQLFPWFCSVFVDVESETDIVVFLNGGIPLNGSVRQWAEDFGAELVEGDYSSQMRFGINVGMQEILADLASHIKSIVGPGKRYDTPAYKYVCPRTAATLFSLKSILDKAWS